MSSILKSASRIWMLLSILVTCIVFGYVVIMNVNTETVVIWVITIFTNLMTWITVFYYTKKQTNPDVDKI
jgi:Na+-driven multidrug efflux pump